MIAGRLSRLTLVLVSIGKSLQRAAPRASVLLSASISALALLPVLLMAKEGNRHLSQELLRPLFLSHMGIST